MRAIAREQAVLCGGFSTGRRRRAIGDDDFGAREAAVRAALVERHGAEAVAARRTAPASPRVACDDVPTLQWRHRYERLLRLLETRLGLV